MSLSSVRISLPISYPEQEIYGPTSTRRLSPRRLSLAHKAGPRWRHQRRFVSQPVGVCCAQKGRCYLKPLLGGFSRRTTRKTSDDSGHLPFGEIDFLKSKLGFTLPSAESIVKSMTFIAQPKGKLSKLSDATKRYTDRLLETRQLQKKNRARQHIGNSRSHSTSFTPRVYSCFALPSRLELSRSAERMFRIRNQETSQLDLFLRTLKSSLERVTKSKERALLPQTDGSLISYSEQEIESFYKSDEETLQSVKNLLKTDKKRAPKPRPTLKKKTDIVHSETSTEASTVTSILDSGNHLIYRDHPTRNINFQLTQVYRK
ncbi:hypothetical protein RRG08_058668 [Elysia crispata]|uniref:Uncharacterized protein n=1 Tax=Elysia crispata TaxID=231223 RepID=A0AAE1D6N7_9GAST|nr:hypothetical protein RRG08_058668 [Elysia crispata]